MAEEALANGIGRGSGKEDEADDRPEARGPSDKRLGGKRLVGLVVLPVLLLGALGAGGYAVGLFASPPAEQAAADKAEAPATLAAEALAPAAVPYYYELPDMLVELETGGEAPTLLKISAALEVADDATVERLHRVMPRVLDNFQVYLSELDIEDLRGADGFHGLSEALLLRVNASIRPAEVREVRMMEVLVQ